VNKLQGLKFDAIFGDDFYQCLDRVTVERQPKKRVEIQKPFTESCRKKKSQRKEYFQ
jgi:hypothetical protein